MSCTATFQQLVAAPAEYAGQLGGSGSSSGTGGVSSRSDELKVGGISGDHLEPWQELVGDRIVCGDSWVVRWPPMGRRVSVREVRQSKHEHMSCTTVFRQLVAALVGYLGGGGKHLQSSRPLCTHA
jgi:hypothetical protein